MAIVVRAFHNHGNLFASLRKRCDDWDAANKALATWMRETVAPNLPDTEDGRHVADLMRSDSPFAAASAREHGMMRWSMEPVS